MDVSCKFETFINQLLEDLLDVAQSTDNCCRRKDLHLVVPVYLVVLGERPL